jgi:hypothetical protein
MYSAAFHMTLKKILTPTIRATRIHRAMLSKLPTKTINTSTTSILKINTVLITLIKNPTTEVIVLPHYTFYIRFSG